MCVLATGSPIDLLLIIIRVTYWRLPTCGQYGSVRRFNRCGWWCWVEVSPRQPPIFYGFYVKVRTASFQVESSKAENEIVISPQRSHSYRQSCLQGISTSNIPVRQISPAPCMRMSILHRLWQGIPQHNLRCYNLILSLMHPFEFFSILLLTNNWLRRRLTLTFNVWAIDLFNRAALHEETFW